MYPQAEELEAFKALLNEEIVLHQTIEQRLEEKKQIIIRGDLVALTDLDDQLEALSRQALELEESRLAMMIQMGRDDATLKEFIASLRDENDTRLLEHAREQLVTTTQNIRDLCRTNTDLITQSIRLIEQSVGFIASILAPGGASYANPADRRSQMAPPAPTASSTIIRDV